jgi:hypothetical protein
MRKTHPEWRLRLASSTLMRLRATESQAGLTPRQRRLNVRGAFVVSDPSAVTMKHILIIDDILTTGSTARAAALALERAGAASVWVATLARARRMRDGRRSASALYDDAEGAPGLEEDHGFGNTEIAFSHPGSPQRRRPVVGDPDSRKNKDAAKRGHPETLQGASIYS